MSKTTLPNFTEYFVDISCCRGSVLWRLCDTLYTFDFVDDIIFSHNGLYGASCIFLGSKTIA